MKLFTIPWTKLPFVGKVFKMTVQSVSIRPRFTSSFRAGRNFKRNWCSVISILGCIWISQCSRNQFSSKLQYDCLANGGIDRSSHDFTTWQRDLIPSFKKKGYSIIITWIYEFSQSSVLAKLISPSILQSAGPWHRCSLSVQIEQS